MEETNEQSTSQEESRRGVAVVTPAYGNAVAAQPARESSCPTCAGGTTAGSSTFTPSAESRRVSPTSRRKRSSRRATARTDTAGKTDKQTFNAVLSKRGNRYLTRQLCWVVSPTIHGLETYLLHPRDPADLDLLVEALRPAPSPNDLDVVIGLRGPIAPPEMCNGLMVPIVAFDQIYSFDRATLIEAIPRPEPEAGGKAAETGAGQAIRRSGGGSTGPHPADDG